jgi:two-component system, response regulator YesN
MIDDDTLIRDIIRNALDKDYRIIEVSSHSNVVKLHSELIELAAVEYILPDRDGFEVLRLLRDKEQSLPAIIITGHSDESMVIEAIRKDVADHTKKPLSLTHLKKKLATIFSDEPPSEDFDLSSNKGYLFNAIAKYIENNYTNDLTLDKVARMARMSRFSFCRAFRVENGRTFISYLNSVRIKNAAKLLRTSQHSITEIALSVGYRNLGHFNRVFKAVYKMTPRVYRRNVIDSCQCNILQAAEIISQDSSYD